jgi:hypothetical protein
MFTFDRRTLDGTGAFLNGELERLDQTLHDPLVAVTWSRDIDLRQDVTVADDVSSFTNSTYAAPGGINPGGKNWIGKDTNAITGISLDIGKTTHPLFLWGTELKYTIPELESAMKLGRPIDQQKYTGMRLKHQMDIDEMVYVGDIPLNYPGMLNSSQITPINVSVGTGGGTAWTTKTPDEILADVNTLVTATWQTSAWAAIPDRLLLPPAQYSYTVSQKVSNAGNVSILRFLEENNLADQNGGSLKILPAKWLIGMGVGGTPGVVGTVDRMVCYSKDRERIRYPMTLLMRTPLQYESIYHKTTYFGRLGVMEFVYPETVGYADGL